MRKENKTAWTLFLAILIFVPVARAQDRTQLDQATAQISPAPNLDSQQNVQAYIEFLRSDLRQQKAAVLEVMMQLGAADSAKFWPIYAEYEAELRKLNDQKLAVIEEYANTYDKITDAKADELARRALEYHRRRSELLAKYYERVKQAVGATTAARFLQIEDQLLLIVDLQIDSSLPIVGTGS